MQLLVLALALAPAWARAQEQRPPESRLPERWPAWRGPLGTGFAPGADPPRTWSETQNLRWKAPLPGVGHSTPVLWGERIFLTAALPVGEAFEPRHDSAEGAHDGVAVTHRHAFVACAFDRRDGELLWQRTLVEAIPHEGGHETGSYASASPVTDGEIVFAHFGSRGLYALDLGGTVLWTAELDLLHTKHAHGEASSPALHGDTLVVVGDHEGESFLVAYERTTGEERWRVARDEETTWSSPIVIEVDGGAQVVVSGTKRVRGYALESGELLWQCGGLSQNVVATPVFGDGLLYAGSSYEKQALIALSLSGARGELEGSEHLRWVRRRSTPYVPSPLLADGKLLFLNHYQGFLVQVDGASGEELGRPLRLPGVDAVYASPVAAAGRIYVLDRSGLCVVLAQGEPPKEIARNRLDDRFSASPVLVGRELFLRGERFLYCLAEEAEGE